VSPRRTGGGQTLTPSPAVTPEEFLKSLAGWARGTMLESHGTRFVSVGAGRAVAQLDFKPSLTQLTGRFHAGAIVALADETATCASMWETNPSGELRPELFPLTLQLSINLIRNAGSGTLTAEAQIVHRGRTTLVVDVEVFDDQRRLVAKLAATQLAPAAPPAETRSRTG
jgi:1,4-dihydroxy-2-naphthoyl-CoA hydrolase